MNLKNNLTNDFAYILGVIYGDGYCRSRKSGGEILLKVKDNDFALNFKRSLDAFSGLNTHLYQKYGMYHARLCSKKIADEFINFDINRILELKDLIKLNFLGGMFDSEGAIIGQNLKNRVCAKRWIHFSNNNKKIINLITSLLDKFNIKYSLKSRIHSGFGSKKLQYEIMIYRLKDLIWFHENKIFKINRKANKLKGVINSYEKKNIQKAYKEIKIGGSQNGKKSYSIQH